MSALLQKRGKRVLLLSGITGTNLPDKDLAPGESPSFLNIRNPQVAFDIQKVCVSTG